MKKLLIGLLVLVTALSLFAGGETEQNTGGKATVEVWFHAGKGEERDTFSKQVEIFNNMQDEIVIDYILLPEGSYNDQVAAAALSGDLPDLLDFDGPNVYNYAWAGYVMPLDKFIPSEMKSDLLPSIIDQGTYAGKIYALGVFDSGLAIWANKEYLQKAGVRIPKGIDDAWTFEEFNDALEKLQALSEVEYAIDFKLNYGQNEWYTYAFSPMIQSAGGDLIDRSDYMSADGFLNSRESVKILTWFQNLFKDGYAIVEPAGDDDFYGTKIAALSWVGHWMYGPHTQGLGDDVVILPMPALGDKPVTGMGSWNWGITQQSDNPEAAWKFLEFLMSKEEILRMTNANGAVPARISALNESELYKPGGVMEILADQLKGGVAVPRPITPAYPTITSAFIEAVHNIVTGADVKTELDLAVKKIDQDIEDNNGYPVN